MLVGRYINEVCILFNVNVIVNVAAQPDGYKVSHDVDEPNPLIVTVALGVRAEANVDAPEIVVTNWFSTEDELDEFCELNINRFRMAKESLVAVPDATEWR